MVNKTSLSTLEYPSTRIPVFEKAREAALTLLALKDILTPTELETLEILLDRKSLQELSESLEESNTGKLEPIENILQ